MADNYRQEGRKLLAELSKHAANREFFINAVLTIAQLNYAEGDINTATQMLEKVKPLNKNEIILKNTFVELFKRQ